MISRPIVQPKIPNGHLIGFEVTELVDRSAICANKHSKSLEVRAEWSIERMTSELKSIVSKKDRAFSAGYFSKILVIHTDEPSLQFDTTRLHLDAIKFEMPHHIDEVFLLFSYSPPLGYCPYLRLRLN